MDFDEILFLNCNKSERIESFCTYLSAIHMSITGFVFLYLSGNFLSSGDEVTRLMEYGNAMYFSIVTWTTLGYGDFSPTGEF